MQAPSATAKNVILVFPDGNPSANTLGIDRHGFKKQNNVFYLLELDNEQTRNTPTGPPQVIAGNNPNMALVGFITLRFQLAVLLLLHAFGFGRHLTVDVIIGGGLLRLPDSTIRNLSMGRYTFHLWKSICERFDPNREQVSSEVDQHLPFNAILAPASSQRLEYSMVLSPQLSPE